MAIAAVIASAATVIDDSSSVSDRSSKQGQACLAHEHGNGFALTRTRVSRGERNESRPSHSGTIRACCHRPPDGHRFAVGRREIVGSQ